MRKAVVDLGSNTFHLLIAEVDDHGNFAELHRRRFFIGLAEAGLSTIRPAAIDRGIHALKQFYLDIQEYKVESTVLVGTSSLRSASNATEVRKQFETIIGQEIQIIDGTREAQLIQKGISVLTEKEDAFRSYAILDIGGGSTECIIVVDGEAILTNSYKLGVGTLYNRRKYSDPMLNDEIYELQHFIQNTIADFSRLGRKHKITTLVGSSGSMEVVANLSSTSVPSDRLSKINMSDFINAYHKVIDSTQESLAMNDKITKERSRLISVGMVLLKCVVDEMNIQSMYYSPYAVKEGLLAI